MSTFFHRYSRRRSKAWKLSGRTTAQLYSLFFLSSLFMGAGLAQPAQAQQARVHISVDSASVGQRFYLSLLVESDERLQSKLPTPTGQDSLFGDLVALRRVAGGSRLIDPGSRLDSVVYEVATFALDSAYVPPVAVKLSAGEDTLVVSSSALIIPIRSVVPPEASEIRDMAPLVAFPRSLWPWVLLALAMLIIVAGFLYYRHRRKRLLAPSPAAPTPEAVLSPYDEAMERLQNLQVVDLYREETVKPFYVELSDLLRTYIERRVHIPALEITTRELVHTLRQTDLRNLDTRVTARQVQEILELADIAKFADIRPTTAQGREALDRTRSVIQDIETSHNVPSVISSPSVTNLLEENA